jgi:acetolactate synthase small subunit
MFYQQDDFTRTAEQLFTADVDGITLIAAINKSNSNIDSYITEDIHYEEIYVIYVELRDNKHIEKIIQIMHSIIPNPAIIIYNDNNTINITTASKRKNKVDSSKQIIEDIYSSTPIDMESADEEIQKFITDIHIRQQSFANLWRLYQSICDRILMREVKSIL